ncbi:alpha/beta hydrolase [Actinoplanes sp. TBRC 11911]|uniref:alpha/beta fold hydrolase n=1 Tax=Actinoplanes sp. TBRC 11911 TaxID=2729386 RepID=UPI00145CC8EF|nr:alpha/beta hydrolase [Actinoplanes sp. TBRC 11911]NMO54066.1 alpha/beta hydrolase [Actinoplanes sp. TBRC 11911]
MTSEHAITVDGVRQVFHVAGAGPICVAHPAGPGVDYAYLRSPELEDQFTMAYVEPVGTGASGRLPDPAGYRPETYVRFLDALIGHLRVPSVFLLGHSYGGVVAQLYTLAHPERVAGLALYSTSPIAGPEFTTAAMTNLAAYPASFPHTPEAAAASLALTRALAATDDETLTDYLRRAMPVFFEDYWAHRLEFTSFVKSVRAWAVPSKARESLAFDLRDDLHRITVPTIVMTGLYDFVCGPRWARMLHAGITNSQLAIFENSGHLAHVEQPADFALAMAARLLS